METKGTKQIQFSAWVSLLFLLSSPQGVRVLIMGAENDVAGTAG